jgi:hypothetical protein
MRKHYVEYWNCALRIPRSASRTGIPHFASRIPKGFGHGRRKVGEALHDLGDKLKR